MNNTSKGILSCRGICWIIGALIGLVVAILIKNGWGLLVGIAVAIALALILQRLFCAAIADTRATGAHAAGAVAASATATW